MVVCKIMREHSDVTLGKENISRGGEETVFN